MKYHEVNYLLGGLSACCSILVLARCSDTHVLAMSLSVQPGRRTQSRTLAITARTWFACHQHRGSNSGLATGLLTRERRLHCTLRLPVGCSFVVGVPQHARVDSDRIHDCGSRYLLQASIIAAGLDGMAKSTDPGEPCHENMYAPTPEAMAAASTMKKLPLYLLDALREFEADGDLQASLGDEFSQAFLKLK